MKQFVMTRSDFGYVYASKNLRTFGYGYKNRYFSISVDWPYFLTSLKGFGIIPDKKFETPPICKTLVQYNEYGEEKNMWLLQLINTVNSVFNVNLNIKNLTFNDSSTNQYVVLDVKSFGLFILEKIKLIDEDNKAKAKAKAEYEKMINCRTIEEWNMLPKDIREKYEPSIVTLKMSGGRLKIV